MKGLWHFLKVLRGHWYLARMAGPAVLKAFARRYPEAFFIQVGANDGQMMDPLRKLVLASRWRGLAIEPVPQLFRSLQQNYAAVAQRVQPVNLAVATEAGELPFFHLGNQPGLAPLPEWANGLGSFRKDVILKHANRIQGFEHYLREIKVSSVTWDELCQRYQVQRIDLVVTDTEGYDFEIIRQIDFQRGKPGMIVYEHHHFSTQTRAECRALLQGQGYLQFEEGLDTWCVHPDAGADLMRLARRAIRRSRFATEV
ncbi:MAG: FkbM family methyltransferase [Stenotrophobium sp.]